MAKMPWIQFFPDDWLYDTRILDDHEKAVWIDLLCFMWNAPERGILTGYPQDLARLVGREWNEFIIILSGLKRKNIAEVTEGNEKVTLKSRRMVREENNRESSRRRKREYDKREKERESNGQEAKKPEAKKLIKDKDIRPSGAGPSFESFWKNYPKKVGKGAAEKAWRNVNEALLPNMLGTLQWQKKSFDWVKDGGKFIPNPATWLNQRRWEDENSQLKQHRKSERSILDGLMDQEPSEPATDSEMG